MTTRDESEAGLEIRPTVAPDLNRLMALNHFNESDQVWQLELRRDGKQLTATFREVRLPRPTSVHYPRDPYTLADDWTRKDQMYTALLRGQPIGYVALVDQPPFITRVTDLVVDGVHRRHGLGGALLSMAQAWAAERSHRRILLEVQSKNMPAIRMAQKFGYEFCGYNDHYYSTQDVALFFAKTIPLAE
jgi:ribosomal protein S18 acetylase RimI-like enzyme